MARRRQRSPAPGEGPADLAEAVLAGVAECEQRHRAVLGQLARAIARQKQEEAAAAGAVRAAAALEARVRAELGQAADARRAGDEAAAAAHDRAASRTAHQLAAARRHAGALTTGAGSPARAAGEAVALLQAHLEVVRRELFDRQQVLAQLRQAELHESWRRTLDAAGATAAGTADLDRLDRLDRLGREVQARHAEAEAATEVALARARGALGRQPQGPDRWAPADG